METLLCCVAGGACVGAAVQDGRTRQISDWWSAAIIACAILMTMLSKAWSFHLLGFLGIGLPLLLLAVITGTGVGGGDVKLCAAIGALVGLVDAYIILLAALTLLIIWLKLTGRSHGAFAPFLCGCFLGYFVILLGGRYV